MKNNIDLTPRQEEIIKILSNKNNTFIITSKRIIQYIRCYIKNNSKRFKITFRF